VVQKGLKVKKDDPDLQPDVIIIGSGAAGLLCAIEVSRNLDTLLLTKNSIRESNTKYAQGGIAAVMKLDDDYEQHIRDTLIAVMACAHSMPSGPWSMKRPPGSAN